MSKQSVTLTYGTESITVEIDEAFLAGPVIRPRASAGTPPHEAIAAALAQPVARPRLREMAKGKRVSIVISDEFRFGLQDEIIEHFCEELAESDAASVTFICATGSHDPSVYAVNVAKSVDKHAKAQGLAYEFVAHDCDDPTLVEVGRTRRGTPVILDRAYLQGELRVFGHESKHHYMAGYSSIDKHVVPGVSARATIEANHKNSLSSLSGPGRSPWHIDPARRDNPFSDDAAEARILADRFVWNPEKNTLEERAAETFGLDMISKKDSVLACMAGDPNVINARMTDFADRFGMFEVEPTKYVLISPGGPPASQAVYGTQNCFDMAMKGALIPGGEACVLAPCEGRPDLPEDVKGLAPDGKSKKLFWDNLVKMKDWSLEDALRFADENFELYLWKTIKVLRLFKELDLHIGLHSTLPAERLTEAGFQSVPDVQAWIDERAARNDGKLRVIDQGNKIFVKARS